MTHVNIYKTVEEIMELINEDRLIGFPNDFIIKWNDEKTNDFKKYLFDGMRFGLYFVFIQLPDYNYEVFDGKQRIAILYQLLMNIDKQNKELIKNIKCYVEILMEYSLDELNIFKETNINQNMLVYSNELELREGVLTDEKRKMINAMLKHNFFGNCLLNEDTVNLADRDYAVILLAFCYDNYLGNYHHNIEEYNFYINNAENRTLPSNMKKFVAEEQPNEKKEKCVELAFKTLNLMNRLFDNTDYVCRAVDFCYIALLQIIIEYYKKTYKKLKRLNKYDYSKIFNEYNKMWENMPPYITLNPLARENLEKVQLFLDRIIIKIIDSNIQY